MEKDFQKLTTVFGVEKMAKTKNGGFIMDEYRINPKTKCIDCKFLGEPNSEGWTCHKYPKKIPGSIWKSGECENYVFENKEIENDGEGLELLIDED